MKRCNYCLRTKSFNEYGKEKGKKDGLKTICKQCRNGYNLEKRFVAGDSKIEECECGKLFINETFVGGVYDGKWIFHDKCKDCKPREKTSVKKKVRDQVLHEAMEEIERLKDRIKELEE